MKQHHIAPTVESTVTPGKTAVLQTQDRAMRGANQANPAVHGENLAEIVAAENHLCLFTARCWAQ